MNAGKTVALVTGANKGIGKETVRVLAAQGWTVYLGSRDAGRGEAAKAELGLGDSDIRVISLDVTDDASVAATVAQVTSEAGRLDVLINNAGIGVDMDPVTDVTIDAMKRTFEVNVYGPVRLTQAMLPLMRAGDAKTIVNLSSELGSLGLHGFPDSPYDKVVPFAYNASKTALNAFTVLLAKQLKGEGFKVNSVSPGYTATDLNGFSGPRTVEQAAAVVAQYAMLDRTGPTGGFFTEGGSVPW
ncbi:SDR family oxidoreductase [Pigmentiphaga litoralis]|uniref:NAD(P)-dependent dehydrogenase (Short-subunit alcohol dehydrogenase family) n=1 Tax=Pigmentiphaga litoralis TaxID=516702 RepID=A0A7Y9ITT6_9BURK|nr:SDR family oxidoreductase [Pigmentiphaga litoralis]NYE23470.1 NAD(P)-dependent dehydrogenase (short-subunit alcohol dehydrogenase family) [Pigmentiphaga litoralis]NYE82916.1 NAD(P)-dependent dehydrogenase (short-subunit alcohol dehydrogenase family) [Pigmentiphaga litoralis]